jgi:hypothetical protein
LDQLIQTLLTELPNLGVAIWMLWQQQQTIKSLLATQEKLIDRLLTYVDNDKEQAEKLRSSIQS